MKTVFITLLTSIRKCQRYHMYTIPVLMYTECPHQFKCAHTYKLTTLCVELWITNSACTKNTLVYCRRVTKVVMPFSRASMIQAPTHLEQQPSLQIFSKIIITQQRSCSINKVCNRRNSGNFIENKLTPCSCVLLNVWLHPPYLLQVPLATGLSFL